MLRAGAVLIQHLIVELCAVALVLCKLILGIFCVQLRGHIPVPADLGQNGRRRNGGAFSVAADDQPMEENLAMGYRVFYNEPATPEAMAESGLPELRDLPLELSGDDEDDDTL